MAATIMIFKNPKPMAGAGALSEQKKPAVFALVKTREGQKMPDENSTVCKVVIVELADGPAKKRYQNCRVKIIEGGVLSITSREACKSAHVPLFAPGSWTHVEVDQP